VSLTLALSSADGLVLAADSRLTEGYTPAGPRIRDDSIKALQLDPYWGVLTYGIAEIGYTGIVALKEALSANGHCVLSVPKLLAQAQAVFSRTNQNWEKQDVNRRDRDVGFIMGGYDRESDTFRIFSLQSPVFAPTSPASGCLLAGQWHIAKNLLSRLYSKELSLERLEILAVNLLSATIASDPQVGGEIRLATVTRQEAFRWIPDDEIRTLCHGYELFKEQFGERCRLILRSAADELDRHGNGDPSSEE
jgi:predicted proteasome-type protease